MNNDDNKMKKFTIILTVLIALTIKANAQIPNSGFENWPLSSNGWPVGNPIQSSEVYPDGVGNYSLKLVNNAGGTDYSDYGFCVTFPYPGSWAPSFPITGKPNSFTGYYKFSSINNDTAVIAAVLYLNGDTVSSAFLRVSTSTTTWSSFNIPFNPYTSADSASVGFSAYNWYFGQIGVPTMQGNSELYIDNLSFDNLITSISDQNYQKTALMLFPNPATDIVTWNVDDMNDINFTLRIYNVFGALVKSEILKQNSPQINVGDLSNGMYMVEIHSKEWKGKQQLIIQR